MSETPEDIQIRQLGVTLRNLMEGLKLVDFSMTLSEAERLWPAVQNAKGALAAWERYYEQKRARDCEGKSP